MLAFPAASPLSAACVPPGEGRTTDPGPHDFARRTALLACIVGFASGAATLAGWALDVRVLRGATTTWLGMAPNTAVALIGVALALWAVASSAYDRRAPGSARTRALVALVAAMVASLLAGSALVERWLSPGPTRLDLLFFAERVQRAGEAVPAGRMAPAVAAGILLLAVAVSLLVATGGREGRA